MEFNSLDAQREACEAYIASQKPEGWMLHEGHYDDGGVSGATLDRPGLKSMIVDIESGFIDVVVVYKIDRLSRSLRGVLNTDRRSLYIARAATRISFDADVQRPNGSGFRLC